ncbi:MAG: ABC transporter permease, partial [Bacteroidota bacterium]
MNFPGYIAKRYVRSKSSQNAVNIINFITFLVIVIGSAALFIVLSGFAGLKSFSLAFSQNFDPDLKAVPTQGKYFSISPKQEKALGNISGIQVFSKELEEQVLLMFQEKFHPAYVKGVDANYNKAVQIDSAMYYQEWVLDELRGVSGIGIVNLLNLTTNQFSEPLEILAVKPGKGPLSLSMNRKLYNTLPLFIYGVYAIEENLDKKYVFANLPLVQGLLDKDSLQISGINFKMDKQADLNQVKDRIGAVLGDGIQLKNRQELNSTLHRMLNTENLATYLIFTLVLIIALFNVVGALIMMILDKQQNS